MTLALVFDGGAAEELATVADWYEAQRRGAGDRFLAEVGRLLDLARDHSAIGVQAG